MATNIKGITIEIGANTQPLSQALNDITKKSSAVQKELNQVNKALDLDPTNAEQVARKMELLEKQADLAEQKVDRLKQAQDKMKADGVSESSEEYKRLATQLANAEGEFNSIQATIKETSRSFNDISESGKLVQTYFDATGSSADDLVDTLGSKLVQALNAGSLQGGGYVKTFQAISKELTGTTKYANEVKQALSQINQGVSLDKIKQDLLAIGNTKVSNLGVEFEEISHKSAQFDKELKEINQSLKLDPSNLDLVVQKQTVLSQAVENSESKLQALNQRFSELKANNVDLNDEEFRNLQREIVNTESALSGYKSQLSDLQNAQQRLNTYFEATGTSVKDFSNVLGSDLVQKIERGEASSQELANALDKIGSGAISNKGDIDRFKQALDSVDSGVSFDRIRNELNELGQKFEDSSDDANSFQQALEKIADSTGAEALAEIGEQVGEVGDKLREFGEGAIEAAGTVKESTNSMKINLGLTDEAAREMSEHAQNVYFANYGESLDAVTEAIVFMQQNLDDVNGDNIESLASQALTLSDTMGVDLNEAVRGAKSMMEAYGMSSQEAFDLMVAGASNGMNVSDELGDNLAEYSPLFKDSGYSASEMFSILQAGLDAGAYNLDKVNDLVKEFGIRISDGSVESAVQELGGTFEETFTRMKESGASNKDIFSALVGEIQNLGSEQEKAAAISAIFGSQGEDAGIKVIEAMGSVVDTYSDVAGAAQQAADDNDNAVGSMQRKWEELGQAFAPLGEDLAELANKILDVVVPAIEKLVDWFTNLPEPVRNVIEIIGSIVAGLTALAPIINILLPALSGLWTVITTIAGVLGTVVSAIGGVLSVIGAPLLAAIAAVVAVVVGLIAYFNNWGGCADWLNEKWSEFITWLVDTFNNLGSSIGQALDNVWSSIQSSWENIKGWFSESFESIKNSVTDIWNEFITGLTDKWNSFWDSVKSLFDSTGQWLSDNFNKIKDTLTDTWNDLCNGIGDLWTKAKDNLSNIGNNLKDNLSGTWNNIKENANNTWNNISSNLNDNWNNLKNNAGNTWDNIKTTIINYGQQIKDNLSGKWNEVVNDFSNIWNGLRDKASDVWENVKRIVSDGVNALKNLMNFHWELPQIKLPHFKISGNFSLNPPSIPTIGVDWYAKGGILTKPTIFGMNGNNLLGGGEAGKEAVMPLNDLYERIDNSEVIELLKQILKVQNPNIQVVLDTGTLVGQITPQIDNQLGVLKRRGDRQ